VWQLLAAFHLYYREKVMKRAFLSTFVLVCAGCSGLAHANVYFGDTSLSASSYSSTYDYGTGESKDDNDSSDYSVYSLPAYSISTSAETYAPITTAYAGDYDYVSASFSSPSSGSVNFYGETYAEGDAYTSAAYTFGGYNSFNYDFTNTSSAKFLLNYSLYTDGPYVGTDSYASLYDYTTGSYVFSTDNYGNISGGLTASLIGGHDYGFTVEEALENSQYGLGSSYGDLQDSFGFKITSCVPEPASWAMMIGGIGILGGAMRRQKLTAVRA
jgi:hypothetical protein